MKVGEVSIKTTINDVAKAAGVSISTVSRVVNGNYPVKKETKEIVLKTIKELDFIPNDIAASMVKKKTNTIGVVVPSISNIFFSTLVKGISDVLENQNYTLFLCVSQNNEVELVQKLISRQVDAIIIADSNLSKRKEFYLKAKETLPLLFINGYDEDFNYISCNQKKGTIDALNYLKSLGHSDILFLRGGEDSYSYQIKEDIYKETVENPKVLIVDSGNKDDAIINTAKTVEELLSKEKRFTAVFASNDLMAIGTLQALEKLKINVPSEMCVIGFDNIYLCDLVTPKLTTVDQQIYKLGSLASLNIIKLLETNNEEKAEIKVSTESELIIRESTK